MFFSEEEKAMSDEFLHQGYVIRPAADTDALHWMRRKFTSLIGEVFGTEFATQDGEALDQIHRKLDANSLNDFRLKIIRGINADDHFRTMYFRVARSYLETLVGNELAMQMRINLSIQLPDDSSSLLPVHADTWSGDSPYEVVVWVPMVDCYGSKAMYLLPPDKAKGLCQNFVSRAGESSESLYQAIKHEVKWLVVRYGEVLIFDQALPHGNRVNTEAETRWSMNCRFKGVFTPYGDKKIGEFFEPITLRAASRLGLDYQLPTMS
jgi:sporadic carbohydrate cluster 2OG-Fe(II) oxygenase